MDWLEVSVRVDGEAAEAVSELINRYVSGGAVIEQMPHQADTVTVKVFLSPDADETRRKIEEGLWHLGQIYPIPEPCLRHVPHQEWAEAWKKHYRVLRIGRRVVIRPSWLAHTPAPDDVVIELDPGMAFGTGLHPSTRLCLQVMEEIVSPNVRVLDMGTGSGILSIAAVMLGAGHVLALDVDELAVKAAAANAGANGVSDRLQVGLGSIERLSPDTEPFDIMLVNIQANIILDLVEQGLLAYLKRGGCFVGSGILAEQADSVLAVLRARGVGDTVVQREGDWIALIGRMG